MSTPLPATAATYRHPLGLPAGSVRAILAMGIAGLVWLILMMPADRTVSVPLYLHALLALILVFFAAHGESIGPKTSAGRSPLYLPRGVLRFLLIAGFLAVIGYQASQQPELLKQRLIPKDMSAWPYVLAALFGGYLLGWLVGLGPWRRLAAFQDVKAWISLLALLGIIVEMILHLINASIPEPLQIERWQEILTAIIAFYFGVRS